MKKFFSMVILLCFATQMAGIQSAHADKVDILIKKLVDKGIITEDESLGLRLEMAEDEKDDRIKQAATPNPNALPDWVKNTKLSGDFRARYQLNKKKGSLDRNRGRFRIRLATDTKINDKLSAYFGIASGTTGDPRSNNQSFQDSFDKKPIVLDFAYAKYSPAPWLAIFAGKMKNPLWEPGDLIWDTDITLEGGAVQYSKKLTSMVDFFTNAGVFVLDEVSGSSDDPTLFAAQPGVVVKLGKASWKNSFSYYEFTNVKGNSLDLNSASNTYTSGTILKYGYKSLFPATELSIKKPLESFGIPLPYIAVFGEYILNPAVNDDADQRKNESGYMTGLKLGYEKVQDWKEWQFKYNYARLEKDAIVDILPDSDRYSGKTGITSHEGIFEFGLGKNTAIGVDYYYSQLLAAKGRTIPEHIWQIDWSMKF